MINRALFAREMKKSLKLLLIFAAILTMYVVIMIRLYDPGMRKAIDDIAATMPQLMGAMGIHPGEADLMGFMITYLYGFIFPVFPMLFTVIRGNQLIARYVETGSMTALLAAPVKRRSVALTQLAALVSGVSLLLLYATALEMVVAGSLFPAEPILPGLIRLNGGLWALQCLIAGIRHWRPAASPKPATAWGWARDSLF